MNKITNIFNEILKILFIIILLVLILLSSSSCCGLLREYYNSIEDNQENNTGGKYGDTKEELSDATDYYISPEEEEEIIEVEEELLVEEKLNEVQELYSLEFRLYLESMDDNNLENILGDYKAIKKEYDLFERINTLIKGKIFFTADEDTFPNEWYDSEIGAKAESLSEGEVERSKRIIISALDKYPTQFLKDNLKRVYVLKSMIFFEVNYGGTCSPESKSVYLVNNGAKMGNTDIFIEQAFHHEFSSVLFFNYKNIFSKSEWQQINPAEFVYFDEVTGGSGAIKEGKASQVFDPDAHRMGFLYEYAQSTLENDYNSFAENIFMGDESFFDIVEDYEKLKMKLDLIVEFYNALDSTFTIEYYKGL
ncbi:MAG TPA: hypothetical protein DCP02_07505 [Actinobacteria bacterium]|nr:hypothetical protein [Actinomycetota bacterium]